MQDFTWGWRLSFCDISLPMNSTKINQTEDDIQTLHFQIALILWKKKKKIGLNFFLWNFPGKGDDDSPSILLGRGGSLLTPTPT